MEVNMRNFNEISQDELQKVEGGIAPIVVAYIIVGGIFLAGVGIGAYVGYKEAERADKQK